MNKGLSEELINDYPNVTPIAKPLIETVESIDSKWLTGFIEGEVCFFC
jgi:hypothetical protein